MKSLVAALQFLTICPWVSSVNCSERDIGRSTPFFPVIGILLGLAVIVVEMGASRFFQGTVSSVIVTLALVAFSGGLHMDGLADTADGFFSARPRERILEIMRDSRIGTMGVIAIVFVLGLKVAAVHSAPVSIQLPMLFLIPLTGRCAMVVQLAVLPYARTGGLASLFIENRKQTDWVLALLVLAAAAWFSAGNIGLIAGSGAILVTLLFAAWCKSKIGGFTGDTLGASCEIAEAVVALLSCSIGS